MDHPLGLFFFLHKVPRCSEMVKSRLLFWSKPVPPRAQSFQPGALYPTWHTRFWCGCRGIPWLAGFCTQKFCQFADFRGPKFYKDLPAGAASLRQFWMRGPLIATSSSHRLLHSLTIKFSSCEQFRPGLCWGLVEMRYDSQGPLLGKKKSKSCAAARVFAPDLGHVSPGFARFLVRWIVSQNARGPGRRNP